MRTHNPAFDNKVNATREINLELLALDLDSCTRCVGTLRNTETAIEMVKNVLEVTDTNVNVRKILIESEEQAKAHRFVTSPTIRINNHDIVFETLESECDSCTDLCGCDDGISCRVWKYQGKEHLEAPVGLITESILREIFDSRNQPVHLSDTTYTGVPENLQQFFAGKAEKEAAEVSECCSTEEQLSCCEPAEKESCCETETTGTCGCR